MVGGEEGKEAAYMPRISKNASVTLSLICCGVGFVGLIGLGVLLAVTWPSMEENRVLFLVMSLVELVPVAVADVFLVRLLLLVKGGQVFTSRAVGYLRTISWCCFLECALFIAEGLFLKIGVSTALFFCAGFLGLVLRVVKNVIEEATAIKAENDFTI